MRSPVRVSSFAWLSPTIFHNGEKYGVRPNFTCGNPNTPLSAPTRMSQNTAMSQPPPRVGPAQAAMVGFG